MYIGKQHKDKYNKDNGAVKYEYYDELDRYDPYNYDDPYYGIHHTSHNRVDKFRNRPWVRKNIFITECLFTQSHYKLITYYHVWSYICIQLFI